MSEEGEVSPLESKATPEQQAEASVMGWTPPKYYKGDPAQFIDADKFIERGQTVLPFLQKNNEKQRQELNKLYGAMQERDAKLKELEERLEETDLAHSVERQRAVEQARAEVRAEMAEALKDGDHARIAELTDRAGELRDEARDLAGEIAEARKPAATPARQLDPMEAQFNHWVSVNPWFVQGGTAVQQAFAAEIMELKAEQPGLFGQVLLNEASRRLHSKTAAPAARRETKVSNGASGGQGNGGGDRSGYEALPAEAKKACDDDAKRFVGKGKKYETAAAWRKTYAERYFAQG